MCIQSVGEKSALNAIFLGLPSSSMMAISAELDPTADRSDRGTGRAQSQRREPCKVIAVAVEGAEERRFSTTLLFACPSFGMEKIT